MASFEPRPFGKYFLTDKIAVGGMAEIYKAKTFGVDGFEKVLAIKKILSHYSNDKDFITMLTDEAKLVVNLSHANIVQVYDLGRVNDDYFISMEFIDGINLRELIERSLELKEKIPTDIAIYVSSEVSKGLDFAHSKKDSFGSALNIVHRDVSPQNILVSFDGGVKIVDFGIAKAAMNLSHTHDGILKGKVNYMAPEQAFGKPIDGRCDVFSLGLVFYELLTGEKLFTGESQMEILKAIRNTKITAAFLRQKVTETLQPILSKALAYSVKERYATAADMQVDLTRILYLHYSGFTPHRLTDLLQRWFAGRFHAKGERPSEKKEVERETIFVTSQAAKQVNLVHRDELVSKKGIKLPDTVKPEDDVKSADFTHSGGLDLKEFDEAIETTEKSKKETDPHLSVESLLQEKRQRRQQNRAPFLAFIFIFLAVLSFLYFRYAEKFFTLQREIIKVVKPKDIIWPQKDTGAEKKTAQTERLVVRDLTNEPVKGVLIAKPGERAVFQGQQIIVVPLFISSNVKGAKVLVDAQDMGNTPATLSLRPGSHKVVVLMKGYEQAAQTVSLKEGDMEKNVYFKLSKVEEKVSLPSQKTEKTIPDVKVTMSEENFAQMGKLRVDSNPRGASVSINGMAKGITPIVISGLPKNQNLEVMVSKPGHRTWSRTVVLNKDKTEILANL